MADGFAGNGFVQQIYRLFNRFAYRLFRSDVRHSEEKHRREFMRRAFHALSFNGISGDYVEFGSHGGTTFAFAYEEISRWRKKRKMWAFDSFAGLPDQSGDQDYHPGWKKGKMATSVEAFIDLCRKRGIPDEAYETVVGYYENTLEDGSSEVRELPSDIALVYVDCDLYSSTKTVLNFLLPRMKHGMIIAFDDYFCFSDRTISGERKAFIDVLEPSEKFQFLPFVQYGWHGMSFIVEDRKIARSK